ncbi:MAG: hypothetical protein AB9915_00180 [Candidatus Dojkabacteria bacterium]
MTTKKSFAVVGGLLFAGIIANSISQSIPVQIVQANQTENVNNTNMSLSTIHVPEDIDVKEKEKEPEYVPNEKKIKRIEKYLSKRNAPLAKYAEEFVRAADHYGIDYRLAASISIIESNGGKDTFKKYNAWGWGKKGFANWKEGIWTVSKGLGKYYSKGLKTPKLISKYYCPPSAESWARKVQFVMNEMVK